MHITSADGLAVDFVIRAAIFFDAADNFDLVGVVELRGRGAALIVEQQGNFGNILSTALRISGKDHIFHAIAAHPFSGIFAHDPAHCFDQIGFAAAIGSDNTIETGADIKLGPVCKGFKTTQA